MIQTNFSTLSSILIDVCMCFFANNGFAQSSTNDYIHQDVFFIGREGGETLKPDTIVKQGFLSDGTRFFICPLVQKEKSMSFQRAEKDGKNAIIVAGDINVALAIDSLETIANKVDGVNNIPLYTEANILCLNKTSKKMGIDIRYQLKPYMTPELRDIGFSLQHSVLINIVAAHINSYFIKLKIDNQMPNGVENVQCFNTGLLSGNDVENLCISIEAKPEVESEAIKVVKQLLKQSAEEGITENQLNCAKKIYFEQYNYYKKIMTERATSDCIKQHDQIKRIADAYMLGNPLYDSEEEDRRLISNMININSEFITEVFRQTIKE